MIAKEKIALIGQRITAESVNSVCPWVLFTPKLPEKAMKLKKSK